MLVTCTQLHFCHPANISMAQPTNNNSASSDAAGNAEVSSSKNATDEVDESSTEQIEKNTEAEETSPHTVKAKKTRKRKAIKSCSSHEPAKKRASIARTAKKVAPPSGMQSATAILNLLFPQRPNYEIYIKTLFFLVVGLSSFLIKLMLLRLTNFFLLLCFRHHHQTKTTQLHTPHNQNSLVTQLEA